MEVGTLAHTSQITRHAQFNDSHAPVRGADIQPLPAGSNFDFDRVVMNMEEVKNLLYVVLGGGPGRVNTSSHLGSLVNKLA
ncbi:MAG: hypothetical protein EPN93_13140 [Spirochaetes bacterium]|nr:MAG: hypothetical protein EPN93_13140 [Spirochaetota bacterium]